MVLEVPKIAEATVQESEENCMTFKAESLTIACMNYKTAKNMLKTSIIVIRNVQMIISGEFENFKRKTSRSRDGIHDNG